MNRLSFVAFAALVVATVAAFFVTQHLKVTTPLIAGTPRPSPAVINPVGGTVCGGVDHRFTRISFYLLHRADDVDVYVVDQSGSIVRTLAIGRHMRRGVRTPDGLFTWNGRKDNGAVAPDGEAEHVDVEPLGLVGLAHVDGDVVQRQWLHGLPFYRPAGVACTTSSA